MLASHRMTCVSAGKMHAASERAMLVRVYGHTSEAVFGQVEICQQSQASPGGRQATCKGQT